MYGAEIYKKLYEKADDSDVFTYHVHIAIISDHMVSRLSPTPWVSSGPRLYRQHFVHFIRVPSWRQWPPTRLTDPETTTVRHLYILNWMQPYIVVETYSKHPMSYGSRMLPFNACVPLTPARLFVRRHIVRLSSMYYMHAHLISSVFVFRCTWQFLHFVCLERDRAICPIKPALAHRLFAATAAVNRLRKR